jgi:hypothetical protein
VVIAAAVVVRAQELVQVQVRADRADFAGLARLSFR